MFEITKSTIKLGDTLVKNRTVSSPVSINMANTDGTVTKNIISYFSNLAMNDVGMVTVGATSEINVHKQISGTIKLSKLGTQRFSGYL